MFSGTVPAGVPGTDQLLLVRALGSIRNDSGSAQTLTQRWKYGGSTAETHTTISLADAGATDRYADITTMFIGGENSVSAQQYAMEHRQTGAIPPGPPSTYAGGNDHNTGVNSTAIDSSSSRTLELTAQLSAANTELEYRRHGVWVEHWTSGNDVGTSGTRLVAITDTEATLVNSTTETTVATLPIPGGTLSTGNLLVCRVTMDGLNNSGSSAQWWSDVYWGGVQIFDGTSGSAHATNASRRAFPMEIWIGGAGATNAQICAVVGHGIGAVVPSAAGAATTGGAANNSLTTAAVDSTAAQDLVIKVDMSLANPSTEVRFMAAAVQVVKA